MARSRENPQLVIGIFPIFFKITERQYPVFQSLVTVEVSESPSFVSITVLGRIGTIGGGGGVIMLPSESESLVGGPLPFAQYPISTDPRAAICLFQDTGFTVKSPLVFEKYPPQELEMVALLRLKKKLDHVAGVASVFLSVIFTQNPVFQSEVIVCVAASPLAKSV
mgnify:FL=1